MIALYERALAVEPTSVEAQTQLALSLLRRVFSGTSETRAADISRAKELIEQASAASPRSWITHYAKGNLLRATGRCAEAIPEYETAIASNRNCPCSYADLGWCKLVTGAIGEVIPLEQQAIHLSPRDPIIGVWEYRIGIVHMLQSRTDDARVWFDKACSDNPGYATMHAWLASAYALNRRDPTRCSRACRSPQAWRRGLVFEHSQNGIWQPGSHTCDTCSIRSHLFRRAAQGRGAGGMTSALSLATFSAH